MLNTGAPLSTPTFPLQQQQQQNKRFKYAITQSTTSCSIDTSTSSLSTSANDSTSSTTPPLSPSTSSTALNLIGNKFNKIANFQSFNQLSATKTGYPYGNYENYSQQPQFHQQQQQQHQQYYSQYYNQNNNNNNRDTGAYDLSMQCQINNNENTPPAIYTTQQRSSSASLSLTGSGSGQALPLKKRRAMPTESKDMTYWEKRRKNNESAKRSRDLKRTKEETLMMRNLYLEQENLQLKTQIAMYETQIENLSRLAHGLGGHIIGSSSNTQQ